MHVKGFFLVLKLNQFFLYFFDASAGPQQHFFYMKKYSQRYVGTVDMGQGEDNINDLPAEKDHKRYV